MVEKNESVAEDRYTDGLEMVVLHGYLWWEAASINGLVGRPSQAVSRTTCYSVDLFTCYERIIRYMLFPIGEGTWNSQRLGIKSVLKSYSHSTC